MKKIFRYWPIFILIAIETILFWRNFAPGTYLIGWDNVMPEFNLWLNLKRNLFAVWQEYRSLGLLDGMAHTANLIHTLTIALLSIILPQNTLRYVFNFGMHLTGGIGIYALMQNLLHSKPQRKYISLAVAVFYMLNAFTIQMFYTPLEAFSVHFASLPLIGLTYIKYLETGRKRQLGLFLLTCFLFTPQFFVTPLILPVAILLVCLSIPSLRQPRRLITAAIGFIIVNSFWMLPYIYSIPLNAPLISQAKINQLSSGEIYLRNQVYGDLKSLILMRSFTLDFLDLDKQNQTVLMMDPWRNHLFTQPVNFIYTGIFILAVLGIAYTLISLLRKKTAVSDGLPFVLVFTLAFIFLGTNIPLIREFNQLLRQNLPFFGEAFRFTFTKFGLLYAFSISILLGFGLSAGEILIKRLRVIPLIITAVVLGMTVYAGWPAFQGEFIYPRLKVVLPGEYLDLFSYMKDADSSSRIALLPQPDYWNWKYYSYGVRGSGFLWYGLPQATLDRAFDPWSNTSENYYWELSYALYSKDINSLKAVFNKYNINFILLDENLFTSNYKTMYVYEIKELLQQSHLFVPDEQWGRLSLYKREFPTSPIKFTSNLPVIGPTYDWNDNDMAYKNWGNYVSGSNPLNLDVYYPFRSVFSKRTSNLNFTISEDADFLIFSTQIPEGLQNWNKNAPSPLPDNQTDLIFSVGKMKNLVYDSKITQSLEKAKPESCQNFRKGTTEYFVEQDGVKSWLTLKAKNQRNCLSFGLTGNVDNQPVIPQKYAYVLAVETRHISGRSLQFAVINTTARHTELDILLPTTSDWQTSYFILPPLARDGINYDVYFMNDALGDTPTVNQIKQLRMYKMPYEYLSQLNYRNPLTQPNEKFLAYEISLTDFQHPDPSQYFASVSGSPAKYVILEQAFHAGWQAYKLPDSGIQKLLAQVFPFIFAQPLQHVMVNNWANGWLLPTATNNQQLTTVYILFWPQMLEYAGFILLAMPFIFIMSGRFKQARKRYA